MDKGVSALKLLEHYDRMFKSRVSFCAFHRYLYEIALLPVIDQGEAALNNLTTEC